MTIARFLPSCVVAAALVTFSCSSQSDSGGGAASTDNNGSNNGDTPNGVSPGNSGTNASTGGTSDASVDQKDGSVWTVMDSGSSVSTDSGMDPIDASGPADSGESDPGMDSGMILVDAGSQPDASPSNPPPPNDKCSAATVISLDSNQIDLAADTTYANHDIQASCSGQSGPDVFYQFTVSKRVMVYADTLDAGWNTVLFLLSSNCTPITTSTTTGDAVCNDDSCGTSGSRIVALLQPGNYKLGLAGANGAAGAATIHFEFALAASGTETPLPQGASTQTGTTTGNSGNVNNGNLSCIAAGPENGYWWATRPNDVGGQLTASTCGGASWETLLETEIPRSQPYACALDSCGLQTALSTTVPAGAGLHVLLIDGQAGTSAGAYTMQVSRP